MLFIAYILSFLAGFFAPATLSVTSKTPIATVAESNTSTDKLAWTPDRKLTWEDFKGAPDAGDPHHALTTANLALDAKCKNNQFVYEVSCVFLADQSWSKNKKSAQLLYHEQLHFDLTEVHARLLRKKLEKIGTSCEDVQKNLNPTVKAAFAAWKAEQDKFDMLSNHGLDSEVQQAWAADISQRLQELEAYQ